MKRLSSVLPTALLLLPSYAAAADKVDSFIQTGVKNSKVKKRRIPDNELLGLPEGCPSALQTCRGSHTPGSLNYKSMIGFLDKFNPSPEGAIAQFRVILEAASGFSGDSFQPDLSISEEDAESLTKLTPHVVESIQEQAEIIATLQEQNNDDIQENDIDAIIQAIIHAVSAVVAVIDDIVDQISTVIPFFGDIANFIETINTFFTNELLLPLLQDDIVIALLAATFALNAGLMASFSFADTGDEYEYEYYRFRLRKLQDQSVGMGCIANLVSCQIELFIEENAGSLLETSLMADAAGNPIP